MKRGLVLLAAILCCFTAYSQEQASNDNIPTFVVTPRLDVNPYVATASEGYSGFDHANSSLYTFLDGSVGDFSYSLCNHWLSTDPKSLYTNAFNCNECDFIDWLTLSYAVGRFNFTVGKDMLAIGTWELDYYDVDVHTNLASPMWHKMPIYQWGASVDYTTKDESTTLRAQFATSPFGYRPFTSKLFAYSLYVRGEYGCFQPIWSLNFFEHERGEFVTMLSLGNAFTFGDFTLEVDYSTRFASREIHPDHEWSLGGQLLYNYRDKIEVFAKGGYENYSHDIFGYEDELFVPTDHSLAPKYWYVGGGLHYFPLHDSRDLRLHAVAAYNNFAGGVSLTFGATYHFNLTNLLTRNK